MEKKIRRVYATAEEFEAENRELSTGLPFSENTEVLGNDLMIGSHKVANRLACQAMEGCDGTSGGSPDELTVRRYMRLARGGAGIIWFEATAVCREGRANPRQLWIKEDNVDDYRRLLHSIREEAVKANGYAPLIIMQATHSGRYSKPDGTPAPIIAYNDPIFEGDKPIDKSRIITDEGLDRVKEELIHVSMLAERAGFDGVDIKCCHRYLNCELLSAFTRENSRYGGSYENRTRLLRESVAGAMQVTGKDFIVSSRLNVYDGFVHPYGFGVKRDGSLDMDLTEPKMLLRELADMGVGLLNITMGNPYVNPHVNRPFAKGGYEHSEHPLEGVARMLLGIEELQRSVPELPLIASGLSYLGAAAPGVAAAFIERGGFAFAGFGRLIFADPDFAKQILTEGGLDTAKRCIACSKCTELMRAGSTPGCVIRDPLYSELYKKTFAKV